MLTDLIAMVRLRNLFYGWRMAVVGGLIMAIGTVPLFQGLPVWNPVLRSTFGWTASQMSWAFAVTRIEGGLLGPVEGLLVENRPVPCFRPLIEL